MHVHSELCWSDGRLSRSWYSLPDMEQPRSFRARIPDSDHDFDLRPLAAGSALVGVDVGGLSMQKMGAGWCDDVVEPVLRRRITDMELVEEHLRRQV